MCNLAKIGKWDYDTYYSNFQKMSKEVSEKYGTIIPWDNLYWNFAGENNVGNVNIVLLAGKDGEGYVNGGNGTSSGDEVYKEFKDAINKELLYRYEFSFPFAFDNFCLICNSESAMTKYSIYLIDRRRAF